MGCKDTDIFLISKFFCNIFAKNFTFLFSTNINTLKLRALTHNTPLKELFISPLRNKPAAKIQQAYHTKH